MAILKINNIIVYYFKKNHTVDYLLKHFKFTDPTNGKNSQIIDLNAYFKQRLREIKQQHGNISITKITIKVE